MLDCIFLKFLVIKFAFSVDLINYIARKEHYNTNEMEVVMRSFHEQRKMKVFEAGYFNMINIFNKNSCFPISHVFIVYKTYELARPW